MDAKDRLWTLVSPIQESLKTAQGKLVAAFLVAVLLYFAGLITGILISRILF